MSSLNEIEAAAKAEASAMIAARQGVPEGFAQPDGYEPPDRAGIAASNAALGDTPEQLAEKSAAISQRQVVSFIEPYVAEEPSRVDMRIAQIKSELADLQSVADAVEARNPSEGGN